MKKQFYTFLLVLFAFTAIAQDTAYIPANASWKYLDNGSNQGTNWRSWSFNDTSWASGNTEIGYGDGGEATVVNAGCTPVSTCTPKIITTYLRKRFFVSDTSLYKNFALNLIRDDGAVIYVNDSEVVRSNMPTGTIAFNTWASSDISGTDESTYNNFTLATRYFKRGWNVIAVEIHQVDTSSNDISFNLNLTGIRKAAAGLQFNGSNQHVTFGTALPLCAANFTLECWFRRTGTGATTSTGTGGVTTAIPLITKGRGEADGSNVDVNYFFGIDNATSKLCADFEEGTGQITPGLNHPVVGVTAINNNQWYHGSVTYDGVKWKLYLNGALEKTDSVNRLPQFLSIQHAALATAMTSTGAAEGYFAGQMDEVRIWNYARTNQQIIDNMNREITDTVGLLGYYRLNDSTGTIVRNSGSTTVNGTMVNTPVWVGGSPFNAVYTPLNFPPVINSANPDTLALYSNSTNLTVNVSDPENKNLTVTFYGRQKAAVDSPTFTIIPLSDTQFYAEQSQGGSNAIWKNLMNWVVANKEARNIKFLAGLGDCVQNGDKNGDSTEWMRADSSFRILENPSTTQLAYGLPYVVSVGNHDQGATGDGSGRNGSSTFFNTYFGKARFTGRPYYGGSSHATKNNNSFQLFSASGMNFINISFEYDTNMDTLVLRWADSLLAAYPSRRGIITSHWIINSNMSFSAQGQSIYDRLKSRPNLHLMLCGHVNPNGESFRTDVFNGNKVMTFLSDFQDRTQGGTGWNRIMEFRPSEDKIYIYTYSPWLNQYETDANSQFSVDYDMSGSFSNLGSVTVASGLNATFNWTGLANNTKYDWYAVVSDSVNTLSSKINKFSYNPVPVITAPNGGEIWKQGSTRTVTCDGKCIKNMKLDYSTNGSTWTNITNNANGNSFAWTLPAIRSNTVRLRLTDTTGGGTRFDTSNAVFTIYSDSFIVAGDFWNYKDNGSNQDTAWRFNNFVDTGWANNKAEFGYGDGDEATLVNACGTVVQNPTCSNKYITTYFRKRIFIEDISKYSQFKMAIVRDDGPVVYVNGTEVFRDNIGTGTVTYTTLAPVAIGGADEYTWVLSTLNKNNFVTGWNTVAVEMHQQSGTSSDLSFNFRLWGDTIPLPATAVVFPNGGEKLNMGANINVRWSANVAKVKLEYSLNNGTNWSLIADRLDGASGIYNWQVPNVATNAGLVRVTDTANATTFDVSNAVFSIGTDTILNLGYMWKYRDLGTDPGATWKDSTYNDSTWASGLAELGYGDGGEATVVSYGADANNKYRTTYFRRKIFIPNAARYNFYRLGVVRDDGAVVYVNGQEVWRNNMPTGTITDTTYANVTADGANETAINASNITFASRFVTGWNTIAVSIHQVSGTSSDISFNARIIGDTTILPSVVVTAPNGGELIYAGSTSNITWTNNTLTGKVKIEYSTTGGSSWNLISNNTLASAQTFAWSVPNAPSTQCLIKISDSTNASLFDTSNAVFSILAQPAAFNPCVNPKHIGCFTSVQPMAQTQLLRIDGSTHNFQRIIKAGDALSLGGAFGNSGDFTNFVPINGSSKRGALCVNHETTPGGVSVIYLSFNDTTGLWRKDSSGAVSFSSTGLALTANNCSGGLTPWMTSVTAEETTTAGDANSDGYQDLGWLVEFDPLTRRVRDYNNDGIQDKLWAMGRMNHENVVFKNDSLTAYYGEDGNTQCVYKFVAFQKMRFDSGTVYVLQRNGTTGSGGTWITVPNSTQAQRNAVNTTAGTLGGTNFNGVEDVEINPLNGMIYFTSKGNGIIYRFTDNGSTVSNFENYVTNQSYPINYGTATLNENWGTGIDNLVFDDLGNLYAQQDGGRNHLWLVRPDHTPASPKIELFATTPAGSEPTGLTFTPDFKYGFLSFQHPSANTQKQVDAAGDSIQFNTHTTIVFARKNDFGPKWNYVFDDGNITVLKVGDGLSALSNRSAPLSVEQFTASGVPVNSVTIPRTGSNAICVSGSATSEGALTLASNNSEVTFAGYKTDTGRVSVASTTSSLVPRAVARVTPQGTVSIPTQTDTGFSTNNIRGAFTNGTGYWAVGGNSGLRYGTSSSKLDTTVSISSTNNRIVNSFGGQLYFSTGSGTRGIYRVGNGMPTSSGLTATLYIATGSSSSPYAFSFNNDSNICYVADDNASSAGGIQKWRRISGAWTLQYTLGTGVTNIGARGLAVNWNTTPATIFATTAEAAANRIIRIVDSNSTAAALTLSTAPTNTVYRGIAFAPGSAPLPVEFADFNLKKAGKNLVDVSWSTASEINNDYFTVERSFNAADFENAANVKGAGNSNHVNNYNYLDQLSTRNYQPAIIYYRIKQTDFDGNSTYSVIKSINLGDKTEFEISEVYPNPFNTEVNLKITSDIDKEITLSIVDINGKSVLKTKTTLQKGENNLLLELEQLKAGAYILSVSDGKQNQTFKLVK